MGRLRTTVKPNHQAEIGGQLAQRRDNGALSRIPEAEIDNPDVPVKKVVLVQSSINRASSEGDSSRKTRSCK